MFTFLYVCNKLTWFLIICLSKKKLFNLKFNDICKFLESLKINFQIKMKSDGIEENVKVSIRCRPLLDIEKDDVCVKVIYIDNFSNFNYYFKLIFYWIEKIVDKFFILNFLIFFNFLDNKINELFILFFIAVFSLALFTIKQFKKFHNYKFKKKNYI